MSEIGEGLPDFLSLGENEEARIEMANKALVFAQQHLFFVTDPRAVELLKFWKNTVVARRVPVGSTLDAYAAAEAVRAFVFEIDRQVEIAKTGNIS